MAFRSGWFVQCDNGKSDLPREGSEPYAWISRGRIACRGILACLEHNPEKVERLASELIELSTRREFCALARWGNCLSEVGREAFRGAALKVSRGWRTD